MIVIPPLLLFPPVTRSVDCFDHLCLAALLKMNAATALRARMATSFVARRGFSTTRAQLGSPYHYAEGPRSNIPFNPLTKFFFFRYWAFMITGFGAPFAIAVWQTYKTK
ncbi:hypothetical protein ETB97_003439 [Aspergillus alliaceus]|uniref:Cytochrome c oxidase subunit 8, mitochondrial n=2 Tax=Petromyces alliaceus TaxID=209559 RepID=A0A8H5ZY21_PETAA|nr:hypothetical protein ETB97_003439 [Aspergillus burnettii]